MVIAFTFGLTVVGNLGYMPLTKQIPNAFKVVSNLEAKVRDNMKVLDFEIVQSSLFCCPWQTENLIEYLSLFKCCQKLFSSIGRRL